MNRFSRTVLPALAALLMGAAATAAQTVPSPYRYIEKGRSLTVSLGYLEGDATAALPDSQSVDLWPDGGPMLGLRYAMRVGGPLSLEAGLGFVSAQRALHDAVLTPDTTNIVATPTGDEVTDALVLADLGVRFHLTGDRTYRGLAPFVMASGGVVARFGGSSGAEEEIPQHRRLDLGPGLAVGTGAGVDYFLDQRLSLRAELSYRLLRFKVPSGLLSTGNGDRSEWSANTGVSLGAAYHF